MYDRPTLSGVKWPVHTRTSNGERQKLQNHGRLSSGWEKEDEDWREDCEEGW